MHGQQYRSLRDEIDTDEDGGERTTPAGSVWTLDSVNYTDPRDGDVWNAICGATGAWVVVTLGELARDFTPVEP